MKLTFAGAGSAFSVDANNYHSNILLETDENKLLIDCGSDARWSLNELGLSYRDIHSVYISHLHADHVGGLEWLALSNKFDPAGHKPNLYLCEKLVHILWNQVLSGGLNTLQTETATLSTYFCVHPVPDSGSFTWQNIEFRLVQTLHIVAGFTFMPSYGLIFTVNDFTVFITTDTQFCPHQLRDIYNIADLIFHDCETTPHKSTVHAHYDELMTLSDSIKSKMWLYHYNPGSLPNAVKDGFQGFVKKGQSFVLK